MAPSFRPWPEPWAPGDSVGDMCPAWSRHHHDQRNAPDRLAMKLRGDPGLSPLKTGSRSLTYGLALGAAPAADADPGCVVSDCQSRHLSVLMIRMGQPPARP